MMWPLSRARANGKPAARQSTKRNRHAANARQKCRLCGKNTYFEVRFFVGIFALNTPISAFKWANGALANEKHRRSGLARHRGSLDGRSRTEPAPQDWPRAKPPHTAPFQSLYGGLSPSVSPSAVKLPPAGTSGLATKILAPDLESAGPAWFAGAVSFFVASPETCEFI